MRTPLGRPFELGSIWCSDPLSLGDSRTLSVLMRLLPDERTRPEIAARADQNSFARDLLMALHATGFRATILPMAKSRRSAEQVPDLFDTAASRTEQGEQRPVSPSGVPHVLPADLGSAISALSDAELKQLATTVTAELERRRSPVAKPPSTSDHVRASPRSKATTVNSRLPKLGPTPMTNAKVNAIRAALAAGVKPNALARQFGVSQAAIREALAKTKRN